MKTSEKNAEIIVDGLEVETTTKTTGIDYSSLEYLETHEPVFSEDVTSSKYDVEREPKVQMGLNILSELMGDKINPLLLVLGKYWEVKPARAEIKKLLDAEADSKNIQKDVYLQQHLRENIDKLAAVQSAVDRLRYAITYFKPRNGIKDSFKPMNIHGILYNISLKELEIAKEKFADDKEKIKKHLAKISQKIVVDEI